jgi:hypothetical protein
MKRFVRTIAAFACAVFVCMCASPSFAQGEVSSITGLVIAQKNALAISGATVILARGGTRVSTTQTDASGRFTFSNVVPGIYDVTIGARGFAPTSSTGVVVSGGSTVTLNSALAAAQTSVSNLRMIGRVSAASRSALASATTITQSLSAANLVSTGQIRVVDQLKTLPGVTVITSSAPGDDARVNLRGFGATETAALVDGHPAGPLGVLNPGSGFNFAQVPIFGLSSVDITYGSGAQGLFGSDTIGGAINLSLLNPTATPQFNFEQQVGGFKHTSTGFSTTGTLQKLGYAFAAGVNGEEGNFNNAQVAQTGRPNNLQSTSVSPPGACTASGNDVSPCNLAANTYAVSQNTRNSALVAKLRYDFSGATSLQGSAFTGGHLADSTGNGDNDFLPYDSRLAKIVASTPTCVTSAGGPGYPVITANNPVTGAITKSCYTGQQYAAATSGPQGGGAGRSRSSSMRDYDLKLTTHAGLNNITAEAYTNNYWFSKNSAQTGGIDAAGNYLGTPDYTDFYNTKGYLLADDIALGNNSFGFGYSLVNQLQSGNQLVSTGTNAAGFQTFGFVPDFPSAYFSEGSGFIRDDYEFNKSVSLFTNAWLRRQSVTQKTTFDPRASLLIRPTSSDVLRLSYGRSDGPPSPNLKSVGQVFEPDPGASLTTVSCGNGLNALPTTAGNPSLTSESANDFEAGFGHRFKADSNIQVTAYVTSVANQLIKGLEPLPQYGVGNVTFSATALQKYLTALIAQNCLVPGSTIADAYRFLGVPTTFNVGHELARGIEISGRERINPIAYLDYGYYIESTQQSGIPDAILKANPTTTNGGQVLNIPLHQATISVDVAPGPWEFRLDTYYTEQNNPLARPSYWNSNLFLSHSFNHGKTVLTIGGTNVFNNAAQYYGYIGQGTYARLNQFYTNPAYSTYAPAATATQEFVNGEYTAERFGLTPAQFTLTFSQRI